VTPDELELLREGWDFEAKKASGRDGTGALPDSFWETYSAFANTQGGKILLGAKEKSDGSLVFHGIQEIDKVERDLWNTLANPQKVSANILNRGHAERIEIDGKLLLLIHVPQVPREERPVHLDGSIELGTFIRVHEGDHRVSPDVARRMLADRYPDRDGRAAPEFALGDLHPESVMRYRALLGSVRPDHPFLTKSHEDFLVAIGAGAADDNGVVCPTWAGMWMLGDEIKLRQQLPHWRLSYKELPAEPTDSRRWIDRVSDDGTWNANLFEFYMKVSPKVLSALKVPFALDQNQARIDETEAHHALREAMVNTLAHADHLGVTGIRIVKSTRGFEFINPGLLMISSDQLWKGGQSVARNPSLQRMFSLIQLGEREGSGGPTMRKAWAHQQFRAPKIWLDTEHHDTHLEMPLESLLAEGVVREAERRFGSSYLEQDELGRLAIVTALAENEVSHARIVEVTGAHSRDVTLKLQELMRKGLLNSDGPLRKKSYFLPPLAGANGDSSEPYDASSAPKVDSSGASGGSSEPYDASSAPKVDSSGASGGSSAPKGGSSAPYGGSWAPKGGSSNAKVDSSNAKVDSSNAKVDSSNAKVDSSNALARLLMAKRAPQELINAAVLEICSEDFVPASEIARQLRRTLATVKSRYLPRLVERKNLELLHPGTPTHPQQAYRTKKELES
jgi:ATP-dependent DNA helicase RecG